MAVSKRDVVKYPHHEQQELCTTRAAYRQGKKLTAVKVYTVNDESQHLLLCGVPSLGIQDELKRLCSRFGDVKSIVYIPQYSQEQFTDAYHVQFTRIQSARFAKRHLDCRNFYGGVLHVCYAPEMESIQETRAKLIQRRKEIAIRTRGETNPQSNVAAASKQKATRSKKHPALALTEDRLQASDLSETSCIWKGIPSDIDPRTKIKPAPELLKSIGPRLPENGGWNSTVVKRKLVSNSTASDLSPSAPSLVKQFRNASHSSTSAGPAIKLVPRQVHNTVKKIVYRNKRCDESGTQMGQEMQDLADASSSLEATIQAVRAKIRSASVPRVRQMMERKEQSK